MADQRLWSHFAPSIKKATIKESLISQSDLYVSINPNGPVAANVHTPPCQSLDPPDQILLQSYFVKILLRLKYERTYFSRYLEHLL